MKFSIYLNRRVFIMSCVDVGPEDHADLQDLIPDQAENMLPSIYTNFMRRSFMYSCNKSMDIIYLYDVQCKWYRRFYSYIYGYFVLGILWSISAHIMTSQITYPRSWYW